MSSGVASLSRPCDSGLPCQLHHRSTIKVCYAGDIAQNEGTAAKAYTADSIVKAVERQQPMSCSVSLILCRGSEFTDALCWLELALVPEPICAVQTAETEGLQYVVQ